MPADPQFMTSLARGLAVMSSFGEIQGPVTIANVSKTTGLGRSSVTRCLHTLVQLGYVAQTGTAYAIRPKTLGLAHAFLASDRLALSSQPILDFVRDTLGESSSLGVMQDDSLLYIARSSSKKIMSISLSVGSRLPLYCTSMGRILLANLSVADQIAYFDRISLLSLTMHTQTDQSRLLDLLAKIRANGYAIVNQELEMGLISMAVPVLDKSGAIVAAINVGSSTSRIGPDDLTGRFLPVLREAQKYLTSAIS